MRYLAVLLLCCPAALAEDERQIDYGPYDHFLESKGKAELRARATRLMQKLRGLYHTCPNCKGRGQVLVVVRERYYDKARDQWVSEEKDWRACPTCKEEKMLFDKDVAGGFLKAAFDPSSLSGSKGSRAKERWLEKLESCKVGFRKTPRLKYDVSARYGIVRGPRVPLFPLQFRYVKEGRDYEWYVHDEDLHGPFGYGRGAGLPSRAKVKEVLAGDVLELEGGQIVRVCGIVIPGADGKIPTEEVPLPDPTVREDVAARLEGKVVSLSEDRYSKVTLQGYAIGFVELDGKDLGEDLLERGLARRHPKHKHQRNSTYMKAESAARKAKAGCWAQIGGS